MITAKCTRCLASATGETLEKARQLINHAVGLSRGIKCGDNWNKVIEITSEESYSKVEGKSSEKIELDESPPDAASKPKISKSKRAKE